MHLSMTESFISNQECHPNVLPLSNSDKPCFFFLVLFLLTDLQIGLAHQKKLTSNSQLDKKNKHIV